MRVGPMTFGPRRAGRAWGALAFAVLALLVPPALAVDAPPTHERGSGTSDDGRIVVAQLLGDELECAFEPNADICILNALRPILESAPRGEADALWAAYYQALLVARDELLFVPRPQDFADLVGSDEFYRAIVTARLAFQGDVENAERGAAGIVDGEAGTRAYMSIAAAHEKAGRTDLALTALTTAAERLASVAAVDAFGISDELARAFGRLGQPSAAGAIIDVVMVANDDLRAPGVVKRVNRTGFAGGVCAAYGPDIGLPLIEDGLAAIAELPPAAVPAVVRGTTYALAARGYGHCGLADEANAMAERARAVARDEAETGRERAQILRNLLGTVPAQ